MRRKGLKAAGLDGAGGARHGDQAEGTASDSPGWAGPAPSSKYAASVGACLQAPISLPPTRRYLGGRAHAVPAPTSSHDEGSRASLEMLTARTFRLRALCAHSLTARLRAAGLTTPGFTGLGRAPWSRTESSCFPRKAVGGKRGTLLAHVSHRRAWRLRGVYPESRSRPKGKGQSLSGKSSA